MAEIRIAFGRAVRIARVRQGMLQRELADAAHVSRHWISNIERGEVDPSLSIQERIAQALGLTPAELLEAAAQERKYRG